jgi:hypothetical protein
MGRLTSPHQRLGTLLSSTMYLSLGERPVQGDVTTPKAPSEVNWPSLLSKASETSWDLSGL